MNSQNTVSQSVIDLTGVNPSFDIEDLVSEIIVSEGQLHDYRRVDRALANGTNRACELVMRVFGSEFNPHVDSTIEERLDLQAA